MSKEEEEHWMMSKAYVGMPTPKVRSEPAVHMIPMMLMMIREIQQCESRRLLKILFDSEGSHTLIHARVLPPNVCAVKDGEGKREMQTIEGSFTTNRE
eukprot:8669458-Ditylum_brightwellii.AAC.1